MRSCEAQDGLGLVDVLVASTIFSSGIVAVAHLFVIATVANTAARRTTLATIAAAQKVEELCTAPFVLDADGLDQLAELTRRWTIRPFAPDPGNVVVIDVGVTPGGAHLVTLRRRVP